MATWLENTGALHVHSRYSDGTGTVAEIVEAARRARLGHVFLTDHDTLAAAREGWAGQYNGVTLLVGTEITPSRGGHVLAMKVRHCEGYAAQHSRATLDRVLDQGGFAIIAHPTGKKKRSLGIDQQPWYDWDHPVVRGLEIWSYTHDWVDEVEWWRLPFAYEFWRHPERRVHGPYRSVLELWDRLGQTRRLSGMAGLDCHARIVPLTYWKIFPYERMFGMLRNHLFVEAGAFAANPQEALWDALVQGRGFLGHDILSDSTGTRCTCLLPDGRLMQMGEEAPFAEGATMCLALPRAAEVRWMANGRCRLRQTGSRFIASPTGPGVYRFEALLRGRPWVYTNPFYLR